MMTQEQQMTAKDLPTTLDLVKVLEDMGYEVKGYHRYDEQSDFFIIYNE